jgi:hypothetical protein
VAVLHLVTVGWGGDRVMVFKATFNNISIISWRHSEIFDKVYNNILNFHDCFNLINKYVL